MKNIRNALLVALLLCTQAQLMAQYITLQGKQFYDQSGNPFYPVVCNYVLELAYDPVNNPVHSPLQVGDFVLQPYCSYGSNPGSSNPNFSTYDDYNGNITGLFAKGPDRIKADFMKIKEMGFNTVRLFGLDFTKDNTTGGHFYTREYPNVVTDLDIPVTYPYSSNSNFQNVILPKIHQLLDIADTADLNVIFLSGRKYLSNTSANATDYANYLSALSTSLNNRAELLAYDLDNEAHWFTGYNENGSWITPRTTVKNDICNYTAQWKATIKAADTHHLVTMNNTTMNGDIFDYDPAVMSLDFNSYHLYPFLKNFAWLYPTYSSANSIATRQAALNVIEAQMYWLHNNSSMPWMIGEIGVSAYSTSAYISGDNCAVGNYSVVPWVWGTYADQTDFALQTQQMVKNYEGCGYSWWSFMESNWVSCSYPDAFDGKHLDLLNLGDPSYNSGTGVFSYTGTGLEKPLVDDAFGINTVTTANAPADEPASYYTPYGGSSATNYTVAGTISDGNGTIKDAIIKGGNNDNLHLVEFPYQKFEVFTFSHENGTFQLVAPFTHVYSTTDPTLDFSRFVGDIKYSASAASVGTFNCSGLPSLPSGGSNITNQTFAVLTRHANVFDNSVGSVSSYTVNSGNSPATKTGRHVLELNTVTVTNTGTADFHASVEVDLKPGFESVTGSQTVVYIAPVDFNCNELTSPVYKTDETNELSKEDLVQKSIEVSYGLLPTSVRLLPNPASDVIFIETDAAANCNIEIANATGNAVYKNSILIDKPFPISVSSFASGCYVVTVDALGKTEHFNLIVNH